MAKKRFWNDERVDILKAEFYITDPVVLAQKIGCSVKNMRNHASRLGISDRDDEWSPVDIENLKEMYATKSRVKKSKTDRVYSEGLLYGTYIYSKMVCHCRK